jgi:hypothetical protein
VLVDELGILLVDVAAVAQHRGAEVARGKSADHIAAKTILDQIGDIAGVVDVGV